MRTNLPESICVDHRVSTDLGSGSQVEGGLQIRRVGYQILRVIILNNFSFAQQNNPVGDRKGFRQVVGNIQGSSPNPPVDPQDFSAQTQARIGVDMG